MFGRALAWPQVKKEHCQCKTYERARPDQVGRIKVSHVQRVKRPQRRERKDAEPDDERIDDGDVPDGIAIGEEKHHAKDEN